MNKQEELWAGYYERKKMYMAIMAEQDELMEILDKIIEQKNKTLDEYSRTLELLQKQKDSFTQNLNNYGKDDNRSKD